MNNDKLKEILRLHDLWLNGDLKGVCANLSGADLSGANLRGANEREVNTILSVSGIGRERRQTLFWVEENRVWCGCFAGTLQDFEEQIEKTHSDTVHGENYRAAVVFFKSIASRCPVT